jgi:putative FmdB family regulatory protein
MAGAPARSPARALKARNPRDRMTHPKRAEGVGVPIYEYECQGCRRRVSLLIRSAAAAEGPRCPRCGSPALSRLMSRFSTVKSEDARLDSLADPSSFGDLDENDPQSVARFVKKMGQEMGEDLGDDLDEAMDEAMTEGEGGGGAEGGDDGGALMDPGGDGDGGERDL